MLNTRKTIRTSISLPIAVYDKCKKKALERRCSLNDILLERVMSDDRVKRDNKKIGAKYFDKWRRKLNIKIDGKLDPKKLSRSEMYEQIVNDRVVKNEK